MNVFKVNINRLVSLTVLSALMCVPEMAEAVKGRKNEVAAKKRTQEQTHRDVAQDVRKKNKNEDSPEPLIPEQEEEIIDLAAMIEEADNLAKRGEREEGDEYDPRKVKRERVDEEYDAALVMGNPTVYFQQNEPNPAEVIDIADDPDEQPEQYANQEKKMLTDNQFQALLAKANGGDIMAMLQLATYYNHYRIASVSKVESDRQAFDWYSKAAAKGDAVAEGAIGNLYFLGRVAGVTREEGDRLALEWFTIAAAKENKYAQGMIQRLKDAKPMLADNEFQEQLAKANAGDVVCMTLLAYNYLEHRIANISRQASNKYAFEWYNKAAATGDTQAESWVGFMYLNGLVAGVEGKASDRLAFDWYKKAAAKGDITSENQLGWMYLYGRVAGVRGKASDRLAFDWYSKSAAKGNTIAESALGWMYLRIRVPGVEKKESKKRALEWCTKAADKGDKDAQAMLQTLKAAKPMLPEHVFQEQLAKANAGDVVCMTLLAYNYLEHRIANISRDESNKLAFDWYSKAAEKGNTSAESGLGYMYLTGRVPGVEKDESKRLAFEWYSKAAAKGAKIALIELQKLKDANEFQALLAKANAGDLRAMCAVANDYLNRSGTSVYKKENDIQAFEWYKKAAKNEDNTGTAESQLGWMYLCGRVKGVTREEGDRLALEWFSKAAAKGNTIAEYYLGFMYARERVAGVEKNESKRISLEWFSKAAAKGDEDAQVEIQKLQQAEGPVVAPIAELQAPEVQVDLQEDVIRAIEFNAKAKFDDQELTKTRLGKIKRITEALEAIATKEIKFVSKSVICTAFEPYLTEFQKMLLERTLPDYKACFKGAYTEPVFVNCIKAKNEDRFVQDESVLLWEDMVTIGTENVALASRMLSHVKSDEQPDMNAVYKDAQVLYQVACGQPFLFEIALPQDASLGSCRSFVYLTLKTLEAAQTTYHVNFGGLVNPDPFEPVIKLFGSLQSTMTTLSQKMETAIMTEVPRRNAALRKDEKFKALRPPAKAPSDDDEDDE